jgi:hypothetical protein
LHGGKVDVRDGSPAAPPIRRAVQTFPVRETGAQLEVGLPAASAVGSVAPTEAADPTRS